MLENVAFVSYSCVKSSLETWRLRFIFVQTAKVVGVSRRVDLDNQALVQGELWYT
jgi:hypothetical protein